MNLAGPYPAPDGIRHAGWICCAAHIVHGAKSPAAHETAKKRRFTTSLGAMLPQTSDVLQPVRALAAALKNKNIRQRRPGGRPEAVFDEN